MWDAILGDWGYHFITAALCLPLSNTYLFSAFTYYFKRISIFIHTSRKTGMDHRKGIFHLTEHLLLINALCISSRVFWRLNWMPQHPVAEQWSSCWAQQCLPVFQIDYCYLMVSPLVILNITLRPNHTQLCCIPSRRGKPSAEACQGAWCLLLPCGKFALVTFHGPLETTLPLIPLCYLICSCYILAVQNLQLFWCRFVCQLQNVHSLIQFCVLNIL